MTPGTIVQIYHPRYMGRVGVVLGQEAGKLLVLVDGRTVRVEPSKAVPVKSGGVSNEHCGTTAVFRH